MAAVFTFISTFLKSQLASVPAPTASYDGKTVIVTGATGGLGLEASRYFTRLGAARLILAVRDTERGEAVRKEILASVPDATTTIEVWPLDLASFESTRAFGHRALKELDRLDVLLANAGVMSLGKAKMAEGYELQITVNLISTALYILMLLPLLKRTAVEKNVETVVTLASSLAHYSTLFPQQSAPHILNSFKPGTALYERYSTSKLLSLLFIQELGARLTQANPNNPVIVNGCHPGVCKSNLFQGLPPLVRVLFGAFNQLIGRSNDEGARALMQAVEAGKETHGKYVDAGKVAETSAFVRSEKGKEVQKKVWDELMEVLEGIEPGVSKNVA